MIGFLLKDIFLNFRRNTLLKISSISTISVILLILGMFLFLTLNLNRVVDIIEKKVEITVFLKDDISSETLDALLNTIKDMEGIEKINYISKSDALSDFVKDAEMKKFIDASGGNPLPASIRIKVKKELYEKGGLTNIANALSALNEVENVKYKKEETDKLLKLIYTVRTGLGITGVIFLIVSFVVILNTSRLAMLSRTDEIKLMRMVGATNGIIRYPFVFEGIIDGIIAGSLTSLLIYLFGFFVLTSLRTIWGDFAVFVSLELIVMIILGGIVISVISNILSLQKFLKI